ncbi:stage III sporulation protein AA [Oceanobacillus picturae]|jgi:stage III sporulation protein AA|uniref:stage III sporulation protein AA n=1 Tax=Oceanobacillus picturae TaxID=171693 RepID=UPI000E683F72|nr:stage III sporulation protein AA [Oceanobacillus picturae]RIU96063.1 stage III sporulation protein AA [Oceanobacillus picturae]
MKEIIRLFPEGLQAPLQKHIAGRWNELQEIRCRLNKQLEIILNTRNEWDTAITLTKQDFTYMVNQLSEFSLYRMEDELREGYITIEGGHRIGIAGKVNTMQGAVKAIQHITFLNIRVAKERIGCADKIMPSLYHQDYLNTLFVGPPQTGKTTLLRDTARQIASGWKNISARKVGIVDERSEIAGSIKGVPQHNIGPRADVMDACPKAEGMMMMIRSMSPEVLVVDEIGSKKDVQALLEAINAGVIIISSIHGKSLEELKKRPSLYNLFEQHVFQRFILLDRKQIPGQVSKVYNEYGEIISEVTEDRPHAMDWGTSFRHNEHMGRI